MRDGHLEKPLNTTDLPDFPVIQYADDTLIVLPAQLDQLHFLKHTLTAFVSSTGLQVNYQKSSLIPINIPEERVQLYTDALNCQLGAMPFTYLGLPLGTTKPKVEHLMPLVCRVQKRLVGCAHSLGSAGRLEMANSVLSFLPTFYLSSLMVYKLVIEQIDKYRRHCITRGSDLSKKNPPLAAWDLVCKPKQLGGLGVTNLHC